MNIIPTHLRCRVCGFVNPISAFRPTKDYFNHICLTCQRDTFLKWNYAHKAALRAVKTQIDRDFYHTWDVVRMSDSNEIIMATGFNNLEFFKGHQS